MTKLFENYPLTALNTFRLSANSAYFSEIHSVNELLELLSDVQFTHLSKLVLGGGSNVLFTGDFDGLIILNKICGTSTVRETDDLVFVHAGAGENWHQFVLKTISMGLGGLENLSLIPGCVGAAPIQNIGAYGIEIKNTFHSLEAVSMEEGKLRTFSKDECRFGYRDSIFKQEEKGKYIITGVTFALSKKPLLHLDYGAIKQELTVKNIVHPTIQDVSNAVISIRQSKLPDPKVIGNAGSFFKNPEVKNEKAEELRMQFPEIVSFPFTDTTSKLAAGWMIEKCGWKGKRIGNVGMHEKQALVLVNYGGATGNELINHARMVQTSVNEKFGVTLEMEVNIIS